jgi:ketosteroid isomerase-like protein
VLSAEDRFAIEALHREWLYAELRRDTAAMLQVCTTAPIWVPPNEAPLCGRAAILDWLDQQPPETVQSIEIGELAIAGIGAFAWKLATFRTTFDDPSRTGPGVVTGTHGWLLQRDDTGSWRIAVVTWTSAPAEEAAAPDGGPDGCAESKRS